ncbi:TolC family protein [Antarcticibacterium sp. 1MA-6-2]|uniref:TolC family protein n=1 Tax=Antarcticibacterium sp. 1MA-6-2 TaxID=2908210 RepID=UPI001F171089|nr:TolC family protein [Antarcticibacterium sp. 1MA-6-2]UJH90986.1 TolC family protein [Antarcticibacterium sp. 1MA-6-2]
MLRSLITGFLILSFTVALSQEDAVSLTLEESIRIALENNLDLQSAQLRSKRANVNFRRARNSVLPDLGGSYNIGLSNGRSIDPFTNAYINRELTFSNAGLSLDAVIFNGFNLLNRIRQSKLNLRASQMEVEEEKQNLMLDVTLAYLTVLNNRDLVQLAENRLETTAEQVNRLQTLYNEEVGNPADFTDIQGQAAVERTGIIQSRNNLQESLLNLEQLLNITYDVAPEGIQLLVDLEPYSYSAEQVYEEALNSLPTFKARELRVEAARKGVHVARSLYIPEISLFGQLNTNYSSAAQIFLEKGTTTVETGNFVTIDNQQIPVFANQTQFTEEPITYNDQFTNNLNSVVGVSVRLPIFNGFEAKNNVALEKINLQESIVEMDNTSLRLKQTIEQAHNDMQAAYTRYNILQEQVAAFEESFRINEIRFNSGVSTIVEYTISKNNLDNARINLANAKYEYLLRVKVLDYYRGII